MREQIAYHQVPKRTSAPPAAPAYAGHSAGIHPEDAPYITQGSPRRAIQPQAYDEEDEDDIYPQRPPSSAIRYTRPRQEVYTDGNRRIVVHREPPPKKRRFHWMFFVGLAMFIMIAGYMVITAIGAWWQAKQDDWKYGVPRTFQVEQYVNQGDSPAHPDHFIALNLGGIVEVVQLNPQIPKDDHVYPITTVSDSSTPVSVRFDDTNHDGKIDMLVTIGDSNPYTVILLNNGTQFTK